MEWQDYIADLLAQKCSFDGISLSFNEGASLTGVPPIIKSSILLLDQMLAQELDRNFFVFPEKTQSIFFFTTSRKAKSSVPMIQEHFIRVKN